MTRRLIEEWLPIAELGIESLRERTPMTPFPAPNRLHVWWARRPLVASRAAILASLLPADADQKRFSRMIGIHGDPVMTRARIDAAKRKGERFEGEAYSYPRAFKYLPSDSDQAWFESERRRLGIEAVPVVLDPTAGGGSVPFEAVRLGLTTFANDLNPVAVLVERATIEYPLNFGMSVLRKFNEIATEFVNLREKVLAPFFPEEPLADAIPTNFLWARTIRCPLCDGLIPLSPNWRLAPNGAGIRIVPDVKKSICTFQIVDNLSEHSVGTVTDGDVLCPFPDCKRVVDEGEVKRQAQAGAMGDQLYAIAYKVRVEEKTKSGRIRTKWVRGYRAPRPQDDTTSEMVATVEARMTEWEALGFIPSEAIGSISNYDRGHKLYGMHRWTDLFSPRQLFGHTISVQIFHDLLTKEQANAALTEETKAAFVYLASALDKLRDYNSRMTRWHGTREVMVNTFDGHRFSFKWSYAEMAPLVQGVGYDWAIEQTSKCIEELVELTRPSVAKAITQPQQALALDQTSFKAPPFTLTCKSGDSLDHIADASVDTVVMDPPYYDNVMYAELSDFFYVWLKRTAGHVCPELFRRALTDKEAEAVANPAKFQGQEGAKELANRDYRDRMASIFAECRRVLRPDGVLTLMFTHKATGAWDALTSGLMEAGFTITASWPINTEAEGSLHIKEKAAANSTIFLVCRPRLALDDTKDVLYWEDVEPLVAAAVRRRIEEFYTAGIRGVDLYLSCFGPALEEFSKHWPLKRGAPRAVVVAAKGRGPKKVQAPHDAYTVTPEDALDAARREVKRWRMDKLARKRQVQLDPVTEWFVLAWDAFHAPSFPYDEALRLARVVGVDLDRELIGRVAEKKASEVILWDSARRAARGTLGPADGSRAMLDALHHAAHLGRTRNLDAAKEVVMKAGVDQNPAFLLAMEATLAVLPVGKTFTKVEEEKGLVSDAAADFDALEQLRRLAFSAQVRKPEQLGLWEIV